MSVREGRRKTSLYSFDSDIVEIFFNSYDSKKAIFESLMAFNIKGFITQD